MSTYTVSTYIDMMTASKVESGLIPRLDRLTGGDGACCIPEFRDGAAEVSRHPDFSKTLRRAQALADPNRLKAAGMLRRRRQLCACELQAALGLAHATVSHHMQILEEAGLVSSRRQGKWLYYRLTRDTGVRIP